MLMTKGQKGQAEVETESNGRQQVAEEVLIDELHLPPELSGMIVPFLKKRMKALTAEAGRSAAMIQELATRLADAENDYQQVSGRIGEVMGLIQSLGGAQALEETPVGEGKGAP